MIQDKELTIDFDNGVAWQTDLKVSESYGPDYFKKCSDKDDTHIARQLNRGRINLVDEFDLNMVLDIGAGSCEFIKKRLWEGRLTHGIDIMPDTVEWLKARSLYSDRLESYPAFTMWDVLEHLPDPAIYLDRMPKGSYLFVSVPIMKDLAKIRESKHYRPGEHIWYWTDAGFRKWMAERGFGFISCRDFEMRAGREQCLTYVFEKGGGQHELISQTSQPKRANQILLVGPPLSDDVPLSRFVTKPRYLMRRSKLKNAMGKLKKLGLAFDHSIELLGLDFGEISGIAAEVAVNALAYCLERQIDLVLVGFHVQKRFMKHLAMTDLFPLSGIVHTGLDATRPIRILFVPYPGRKLTVWQDEQMIEKVRADVQEFMNG